MKIDKAIEILKLHTHGHPRPIDPDLDNAIDLGIEALKWRQLMELDYGTWCGPELPGETKD